MERWKKVFLTAGGTYLYEGVWHSTITQVPLPVHICGSRGKHATYSELSHVPTPAKFVGWLFRLLRISNNKDESFKTDLMFVSVPSADKNAEKTFDSFNRMHMIWTDRVEVEA